jgi:hypothetical protein
VEQDHLPCKSHCLLKLPLHLESLLKFPSKRHKVSKCGTYISTSHTCDYPVMSTDSNPNDKGILSTPIPYMISGIPSTPLATTVGVS